MLERHGGVSPERQHLLIVDGHNSHVTIDVVMKAMEVGLDLVTLSSHTSHRLQPLDVGVFAPYKKAFRKYRDVWVLKHPRQSASKKILALWVSLGLKRALTISNILVRFHGTGIWPLNVHAVNKFLGPSRQFQENSTYGSRFGEDCGNDNSEHEIHNEHQICNGKLEISNGVHE